VTLQVYIGREDFLTGTLSIAIVRHFEGTQGPGVILRPVSGGELWEDFDPGGTEPIEPSFRLPGEAGRALLDALAEHYAGREDTRTLRRDYDAALRRGDEKDKLIADVLRAVTSAGGGR
jgi:hypothetical protein